MNTLTERSAYQIFGDPDCMKFDSCMTLFARTGAGSAVFNEALKFNEVLKMYFDCKPDWATLEKL